jgi:hypothetical protein
MTKSETIFANILRDAHYIVKNWGVEGSKAESFACKFNADGTDGCIYQRTVNDVQKQLDKYIKDVKRKYRFGVIDKEALLREAEIVRLVRTGIADGQKFVDELKAL